MNDTPYKDRRANLIAGGILQFILGLLCIAFGGLTVLGLVMGAKSGDPSAALNLRMGLAGVLFYIGHGVLFIWLGVGSIMARRWARALTLTSAALWLVMGVIGMAFWFLMLPRMAEMIMAAPTGNAPPHAFLMVTLTVMTVFIGLIYLVIPLIFFLLYRGKNVKATAEARDPQPRWTDRCPLPVLAVSILTAYAAAGFAMMLSYGAVPSFGRILTGAPAGLYVLVLAAICVALAVGIYRLRLWAWWGSMVFSIASALVMALGLKQDTLADWYRAMGLPEPQIEQMAKFMWSGNAIVVWIILWAVLYAGYLVYVKKYFTRGTVQT
ncbi:MAG: hypothetical protein JXB04_06745 [Kiritimatiellae bacterium]|nr:hypothetical protein [Kiritimatiellia bacterium]